MQNKYLKFLLIALVIAFVVPQITLASWWNPFSWSFWNVFFHKQTQNFITSESLENMTLSYPNPYDASKTDTIKLVNGKVLISDAGNAMPRDYTVATTAIGDLNGDGAPDGAIGIYQGYGANIITPVVFVVLNKNGKLTQTDSVLINSEDSEIKSLSINNEALYVNLLVVPESDMQTLPHYKWKPTQPETIQYKLVNGKLVLLAT